MNSGFIFWRFQSRFWNYLAHGVGESAFSQSDQWESGIFWVFLLGLTKTKRSGGKLDTLDAEAVS